MANNSISKSGEQSPPNQPPPTGGPATEPATEPVQKKLCHRCKQKGYSDCNIEERQMQPPCNRCHDYIRYMNANYQCLPNAGRAASPAPTARRNRPRQYQAPPWNRSQIPRVPADAQPTLTQEHQAQMLASGLPRPPQQTEYQGQPPEFPRRDQYDDQREIERLRREVDDLRERLAEATRRSADATRRSTETSHHLTETQHQLDETQLELHQAKRQTTQAIHRARDEYYRGHDDGRREGMEEERRFTQYRLRRARSTDRSEGERTSRPPRVQPEDFQRYPELNRDTEGGRRRRLDDTEGPSPDHQARKRSRTEGPTDEIQDSNPGSEEVQSHHHSQPPRDSNNPGQEQQPKKTDEGGCNPS